MNTAEIETVLQAYCKPGIFRGVYPCDELPHAEDGIYVCNTDPASQPGEHWVCIWLFGMKCEYFDSYGFGPHVQHITDFIHNNAKHVEYNNRCLQSVNSSVCGHYVIYFAMCKSRGLTLREIISKFSLNSQINDQLVFEYVCQLTGQCL